VYGLRFVHSFFQDFSKFAFFLFTKPRQASSLFYHMDVCGLLIFDIIPPSPHPFSEWPDLLSPSHLSYASRIFPPPRYFLFFREFLPPLPSGSLRSRFSLCPSSLSFLPFPTFGFNHVLDFCSYFSASPINWFLLSGLFSCAVTFFHLLEFCVFFDFFGDPSDSFLGSQRLTVRFGFLQLRGFACSSSQWRTTYSFSPCFRIVFVLPTLYAPLMALDPCLVSVSLTFQVLSWDVLSHFACVFWCFPFFLCSRNVVLFFLTPPTRECFALIDTRVIGGSFPPCCFLFPDKVNGVVFPCMKVHVQYWSLPLVPLYVQSIGFLWVFLLSL